MSSDIGKFFNSQMFECQTIGYLCYYKEGMWKKFNFQIDNEFYDGSLLVPFKSRYTRRKKFQYRQVFKSICSKRRGLKKEFILFKRNTLIEEKQRIRLKKYPGIDPEILNRECKQYIQRGSWYWTNYVLNNFEAFTYYSLDELLKYRDKIKSSVPRSQVDLFLKDESLIILNYILDKVMICLKEQNIMLLSEAARLVAPRLLAYEKIIQNKLSIRMSDEDKYLFLGGRFITQEVVSAKNIRFLVGQFIVPDHLNY